MNEISKQLRKVASELKEGKADIATPSKNSNLAKIAMQLRVKAFALLFNK
jgi:hypothetical protein